MPVMTQNDFLNFLFSLHPLAMGLIVLIFGAGSLVLYGIYVGELQSLLKPSFLIGDFILLPLIGIAINYFYQNVGTPAKFVNNHWLLLFTALIALLLVIISAIRFSLYKPVFLPHIIFVLFINYIVLTFLLKGIFQLWSKGGDTTLWIIYIFVLIASVSVKILGVVYPKTFT